MKFEIKNKIQQPEISKEVREMLKNANEIDTGAIYYQHVKHLNTDKLRRSALEGIEIVKLKEIRKFFKETNFFYLIINWSSQTR